METLNEIDRYRILRDTVFNIQKGDIAYARCAAELDAGNQFRELSKCIEDAECKAQVLEYTDAIKVRDLPEIFDGKSVPIVFPNKCTHPEKG